MNAFPATTLFHQTFLDQVPEQKKRRLRKRKLKRSEHPQTQHTQYQQMLKLYQVNQPVKPVSLKSNSVAI